MKGEEKKMENMLLDSYNVRGTNLEAFKAESKEIGDATFCVNLRGGDLSFLSLITIPKFQIEGKYVVLVFDKGIIEKELKKGVGHTQGMIAKASLGEVSVDFEASGLALMTKKVSGEKSIFYVSSFALPTLSTKAGVGSDTMKRKTLYRDMNLADLIIAKNEKLHLVCRSFPISNGMKVNKVYGCFGTHHSILNQGDIAEEISKFVTKNRGEVRLWEISQKKTMIYISFPEFAKGDYIPGVVFENSDIGICAYTFQKVIGIKDCNEFCVVEQIKLKHAPSINIDVIRENLEKVMGEEKISPKEFPLKETMAKILPYKWVKSLAKEKGELKDALDALAEMGDRGLNREILEKARRVLKKYI